MAETLHQKILDCIIDGGTNMVEAPEHPFGISAHELHTNISPHQQYVRASAALIPADLVPDSNTSRRLRDEGFDLDKRYVVYVAERRGTGHDSSYG